MQSSASGRQLVRRLFFCPPASFPEHCGRAKREDPSLRPSDEDGLEWADVHRQLWERCWLDARLPVENDFFGFVCSCFLLLGVQSVALHSKCSPTFDLGQAAKCLQRNKRNPAQVFDAVLFIFPSFFFSQANCHERSPVYRGQGGLLQHKDDQDGPTVSLTNTSPSSHTSALWHVDCKYRRCRLWSWRDFVKKTQWRWSLVAEGGGREFTPWGAVILGENGWMDGVSHCAELGRSSFQIDATKWSTFPLESIPWLQAPWDWPATHQHHQHPSLSRKEEQGLV